MESDFFIGLAEDEKVVFGSAAAVGGRTEDEKVVFGSAAAVGGHTI